SEYTTVRSDRRQLVSRELNPEQLEEGKDHILADLFLFVDRYHMKRSSLELLVVGDSTDPKP
ncbi:MAG: hypothetical protein ACK55I_44670, partial [bacterium]